MNSLSFIRHEVLYWYFYKNIDNKITNNQLVVNLLVDDSSILLHFLFKSYNELWKSPTAILPGIYSASGYRK
ncbi:hypothetical protein ACR784_01170 [Sphingobacterium multivorum]|uniref:Uncharacterized protein n=1 Tax=Sphingobacterium thalpophilum TaxID=259 RepID=A0ACD5BW03_9SPHI|nr:MULTISPECIES: hypothetical protein [Sphingobacterium]